MPRIPIPSSTADAVIKLKIVLPKTIKETVLSTSFLNIYYYVVRTMSHMIDMRTPMKEVRMI